MKAPSAERPIISKIVDVDRMPDRGLDLTIKADAAACAALAAANDLSALKNFEARVQVVKRGRSGVNVTGTVEADITQICVVSLEPFETHVSEPIDVDYEAERPAARAGLADAFTPSERDPPEAIVDGRIDVGALAGEFLTLSLDPYPKKPGVAFADAAFPAEAPDPSPFAALGRLKGEA